ncbi:MAG TPA: hypothetical protein ENG30_02525 [Thermofilaceae archaeon]|nr:hypothetical protein [Thermofilaceae archaeon]
MGLKRIGWRHIEFDAPSDWDVVAEGQSGKTIFFRVSDRYRPRLEVNWERVPFEKAVKPREMMEKYRDAWKRRLSKMEKRGFKAELKHMYKEDIEVYDHEGLLWAFRVGEERLLAAFWYCEKSERAFTLIYTPERLDEEVGFFKRLLKSFKCHYREGEKALWSLLLFNIYLPSDLRLVMAKFTAALSLAVFKEPDRPVYLLVGYSGLASMVMKSYKRGIREWFDKTLKKEFGKIVKIPVPKPKYKELEDRAVFRGESFALPKSRRKVFTGEVWLNKDMNRVFGAAVLYELRYESEALELLESVKHQLSTIRPS